MVFQLDRKGSGGLSRGDVGETFQTKEPATSLSPRGSAAEMGEGDLAGL